MNELLTFIDANPLGFMVIITLFIVLVVTNIIFAAIIFSKRTNPENAISLKNVENVSQHDINVVKTVIYQIYNNFLEKEYNIESRYNRDVDSVGKNTVYNVVQSIVISYGKNITEFVDEQEMYKNQDLLELYLTSDLNKVIIPKLESLYESPTIHKSDDFELTNKIETVSHEIIDSLILNIKGYGLLTKSLNYLEKTLEDSSRDLFDEIRKSIKKYVELNKYKQKERLDLVKARDELIDNQINLLIGGE